MLRGKLFPLNLSFIAHAHIGLVSVRPSVCPIWRILNVSHHPIDSLFHDVYTVKYPSISLRVFLQCGPGLRYSVDFRMQKCTAYGTSFVKISKTRHKISVDIRIILQRTQTDSPGAALETANARFLLGGPNTRLLVIIGSRTVVKMISCVCD